MTDNKKTASPDEETGKEKKEVDIQPSESKTSSTGDPGRTPGKAEGEDDESAEK